MKRILSSVAAVVALGLGATFMQGVAHGASHLDGKSKTVLMVDTSGANPFAYKPTKVTVKVGTKVVWKNNSSQGHTVTAKGSHPAFDSGVSKIINTHKSYSFTFKKAGTYHYFCILHPYMVGTITVKK